MKVASVLSGKAIWLFETQEMNPRGLDLQSIVISIKNRYNFSTPTTREEIDDQKEGIKFLKGSFKSRESENIAVNLSVFRDGLVAETFVDSTLAEALLEDVVAFIRDKHGLRFETSMIRQRQYASQLVVESKSGLLRISQAISEISAELAKITGRSFEAIALTIGYDLTVPAEGVGPFILERRAGVPFSEDRYFSSASLTTEAHVRLLNRLEALMA